MKQTCPSHQELELFLNGGHGSSESKTLQAHLDSCKQCQTILEEWTSAQWIPASDSQVGAVVEPELRRLMDNLVVSLSPGDRKFDVETMEPFPVSGDSGRLREFKILQRLAGGAQGTMYLAYDEKLHRRVAIKVLNQGPLSEEANQKRFEREARLAAALNDERIVRVHQVSQEPGFPPFIVMEYVAGCSLKQRLESSRPTISEAVRWVRDAALGLSVAHQAGLIHRDIKPSNLMLDEKSGLTRLTDFGLALEQADAVRMTQEGTLTGTPAYMSPEQLSRPESIDSRTDIYSLGVVLYELMSGEVPFRGTLRMTLLQVAHDEPRSPTQFNDQIPVDLETIVLKAMARDPNLRFASAKEFADELDRWQRGIPILSRPTGRIEKLWRWCRRKPAVAALAASTFGLFVTLAAVMLLSYLRLEQSARQKQRDAETAAQQRDAALEVLSQLVHQLQMQFEQDSVNFDDLQKNSLQIAIGGLGRLKQLTDQEHFPEALTAEAFRKMGDILLRRGQLNEARDCLIRAERGFRQLQMHPDNRQQALRGIVETLWSRHDLELETGSTDSSNWLDQATKAARELIELAPSDETELILAEALLHQALTQFDNSDSGRVIPELEARFGEIYLIVKPNFESEFDSAKNAESVQLWLTTVALHARYHADVGQESQARKLLEITLDRVGKNGERLDPLSPIAGLEITLEYLLHSLLLEEQSQDQADIRRDNIQRKMDRLNAMVSDDSIPLRAALEFLQELADQFEEDSDEEGRLFILDHLNRLLESRLAQVPGDEFASLEQAYCAFEIAEAKSVLGYSRRQVRQAFRKAITDYRELSNRAAFEEEHWYYFANTLLSAAEYEQSIGGSEWPKYIDEARQVRTRLKESFPQFSTALMDGMEERLKDFEAENR